MPLKFTILTVIAFLSSLLAIILFDVTDLTSIMAVDAFVNSACLALMCKEWRFEYVTLCAPVLRCISHSTCLFDQEHRDNLELFLKLSVAERNGAGDVISPSSSKHATALSLSSVASPDQSSVKKQKKAKEQHIQVDFSGSSGTNDAIIATLTAQRQKTVTSTVMTTTDLNVTIIDSGSGGGVVTDDEGEDVESV